jgi:hypothetical protein
MCLCFSSQRACTGTLFAGVLNMDYSGKFVGRAPRFKVGDEVVITCPGPDKGKRGVVVHVADHRGDFVHRYHVQFADETFRRFFGFELQIPLAESA